ncbi:hypothetical protein [Fimbriiglobus ruber]|nr:hypothetical protein [Fimbriiglobus ruber]
MQQIDVEKAGKAELRAALTASIGRVNELSAAIERLLRRPSNPSPIRHTGRDDDFVPAGWAEQHGIAIPRSDGIFESTTAWVRVSHGVITGAGLKNQSILSMMISLQLVDEGEERSAMLYTDWKMAFLSGVDPVKWTAENGRGDPDAWGKEDRYSKLLHRVDQDSLFAMDAIVAVKPRAKHLSAFRNNQTRFVEALGVVVRTIRDINREADKTLEDVGGI